MRMKMQNYNLQRPQCCRRGAGVWSRGNLSVWRPHVGMSVNQLLTFWVALQHVMEKDLWLDKNVFASLHCGFIVLKTDNAGISIA